MLIKLVSIHPYPSPQSIPLANAFLKAYALQSGADIQLIDFYVGEDAAACAAKLIENSPAAVGFSMYLWNRDLSCRIAAEVRQAMPAARLICGGPEVTADPASILRLDIFDYIVTGEGEVPFAELCRTLVHGTECTDIPGVLLPAATLLPPPPPVTDLDTIPSPYLTGVIDTRTHPGLLWQLSRGCSFTCDFCFDARGVHGVRRFSLKRLEAELRHFAATGVSQIFVLDSTFNVDQKRAKHILKSIMNIAPDIHFHFEVRSEFIDREMADLFARITCSLQIGLQSSDRAVLRQVGRSFNKSDFTAKVGLLNGSGATFGFDLIYGLPGDTIDGFRGTLDYALSLYPNHLDIFPLAVLPGTRLAFHAAALNLKWNTNPPYILESTESFTPADMTVAAGLAAACDIFYTRGKAVAWFNAVTSHLQLKPSVFLHLFNLWLTETRGHAGNETDYLDREIQSLQQQFLTYLLTGRKNERYLPLVLDLINYHGLYASVLTGSAGGDPVINRQTASSSKACFKLAPSVRMARFTYEIDELLQCGEPRIVWMFQHLTQSGSQAVLYIRDGSVCTESLAPSYFNLLELIQDGAGEDALNSVGLTGAEVDEFLDFALQEGILLNNSL